MSSRCKFPSCNKWVVVGEKYCKAHAAQADPLSIRKVSLADITAPDEMMAVSFALTGLPAGQAYLMTEYKRCDGREKVDGRHVYEGTGASGGGKAYCWYNAAGVKGWCFSPNEAGIGTDGCGLFVVDKAAAPEQVKSTSTWGTWVNSKWEVLTGMKVQALSEAEMQQRQAAKVIEKQKEESAKHKAELDKVRLHLSREKEARRVAEQQRDKLEMGNVEAAEQRQAQVP